MPQSPPTLSSDPEQPLSPPLGELATAIREYLCAADRGEDKHFCGDLVTRIITLGLTCRPKHKELELPSGDGDGRTAHMIWTYSQIIVQLKAPVLFNR